MGKLEEKRDAENAVFRGKTKGRPPSERENLRFPAVDIW
jgi:hypothetical protein